MSESYLVRFPNSFVPNLCMIDEKEHNLAHNTLFYNIYSEVMHALNGTTDAFYHVYYSTKLRVVLQSGYISKNYIAALF